MSSTLRKMQKRNPNCKKELYICDPNKNVKCKGRFKEGWCGSECKCTIHPGYSKGCIKYDPAKEKAGKDTDDVEFVDEEIVSDGTKIIETEVI